MIATQQALPIGRKHSSIALALFLFALTLVGCSASSTQQPAALPGEQQLQQAVNDLVTAGVPGVTAVVQRGEQSFEVSAGVGDAAAGSPLAATNVTRIASVSKPFSAALILELAAQGKLTLTDRVGKLLPTLPRAWHSAQIGQVLQHTSGIPDYIKDPKFLRQFVANPKMVRTPAQLISYVANEPLIFRPGARYEYSDTDNIVAGLIAERLYGSVYPEILESVITGPLGLPATSLPDTPQLPDDAVNGYAFSPGGKSENVSEAINPGLAWASGGMLSTANELTSFVRAYLGGKIVNADVLTDPSAFVPGAGGPPGPGKNSSGLGIYRYQTQCGTVFGHTGNMPGYTAFISADQTGTNSAVVVLNRQVTPKMTPELFQKLLAVESQAICSMQG